jgi:predicted glycosyl hydrolase (DUF1957 family)
MGALIYNITLNRMITWINFLHLYQPPTQTKEIVDQIVRESYALIPRLIRQYPHLRLTMNFSGSLLELLDKYGHQSLLEEYRELVAAGRIELVGSAMYHPILALFPEEEMRRQIVLHTEISQKIFGDFYCPKGFYIPEMAYSKKVADIVYSLGFEWIILDEIHLPEHKPDNSIRYLIANNGLRVLFRDRSFSKTFPPESIVKHHREIDGQTLITAHDGELYGHWHKNDWGYYEKALVDEGIIMLSASEYLDNLQKEKIVSPREANWESLEEELTARNPFMLWNAKDNKIHQSLWKFALFTIEIVKSHQKDKSYASARAHADRGMASCAWWWASGAKIIATAPVCWNPTEIEKGAQELILAIRSIEILPLKTRLEAEKMYARLSRLIWETHWRINALP